MVGRPHKPATRRSRGLKFDQVTLDYLETIARLGTHGNHWTDVAHRFIGDGIERAIRRKAIPRRTLEVSYETNENAKSKE
jgi:hypothetical protein